MLHGVEGGLYDAQGQIGHAEESGEANGLRKDPQTHNPALMEGIKVVLEVIDDSLLKGNYVYFYEHQWLCYSFFQ